VLIVDDGSKDGTGALGDDLSRKYEHVRVVHHKTNRGYGAALKTGFDNCRYDWIFFTDGDHQFYLDEISGFIDQIPLYDLIIGYRKERRDPWHRKLYAKSWNILVKTLLNLKVKDINCAFKLINKHKIENITLHSEGATINTEFLVKLNLAGVRIKEIGVSHRPRKYGSQTGGNPKVILEAFRGLIRLYKEVKGGD